MLVTSYDFLFFDLALLGSWAARPLGRMARITGPVLKRDPMWDRDT